MIRSILMVAAAAACLTLAADSAQAAGRVQLELVGKDQGAALAFQDWLQALSRAGIKNVRIRSGQEGDKAGIEVRGTEQNPLYIVTGIIASRDELLLPGARFRRGDARRLAEWLDDVAKNGPPDRREPKKAFGLTAKQLAQVHGDLAKPVGFATRGVTRAEAVEKIGRQLPMALTAPGDLGGGDEKIEEELSEVSCGTALACILRPAGYCLVPREADGRLSLAMVQSRPDQMPWPVGLRPDKQPNAVLPGLFEMRNVNVENVPVARVIEAIAGQLKAPILVDHVALARHGVDPTKALVSLPQTRTTYSIALRKLLFKAGLKYELRVDEAGKPFLWVSTVKPV